MVAAAAVKDKQEREEAAWRAHEEAQQVGLSNQHLSCFLHRRTCGT